MTSLLTTVRTTQISGKAAKPTGDATPRHVTVEGGSPQHSPATREEGVGSPGFTGGFDAIRKQKAKRPHRMRFGGVGTEEHVEAATTAAKDEASAKAARAARQRAAGGGQGEAAGARAGISFADAADASGESAAEGDTHRALPPAAAGDFTREDEWLLSVFAYHAGAVLANAEKHTALADLRVRSPEPGSALTLYAGGV